MPYDAAMRSIIVLIALAFAASVRAATPTTLPSRDDVVAIMRKTCNYQLAKQATTKPSNGWVRSTFYTGVLALCETTKDHKYLDAATRWAEQAKWALHGKDLRFADNQAAAQVYCDLYAIERDPKRIESAKNVFDLQIAMPKAGRVEWWWCDSLFMAPPAFARMSKVTGDRKYADLTNHMFWDSAEFLFDKDEDLFFRDKNFFAKKTERGKKVFWSRGNGWVVAGIARIVDALPADDPSREKFVALQRRMLVKIAKLQDEDGLWRSSLLDPDQFPQPETSGTAFFCYAYAWAINHGTLDRATYMPVALKAWNGLCSKVTADGKLGYVQKVAGAPGKVNPDDTQEYAVGGFLLAGSEIAKLSRDGD